MKKVTWLTMATRRGSAEGRRSRINHGAGFAYTEDTGGEGN